MGIYPVKLNEWYPPKSKERSAVLAILSHEKCYVCGKSPVKVRGAYADHSLPWGHYRVVWCSTECFKGSKDKL